MNATRSGEPGWLRELVLGLDRYYWLVVRPSEGLTTSRQLMHRAKEGPWLEALALFARGYAFEWAGAPRGWGPIAQEIILSGPKTAKPTSAFADRCWKDFTAQVNGTGNPRHNPLNSKGKRVPATLFMASRTADEYNLLRWASRTLRDGRARHAYDELRSVQGVGPKIASFFLRDVVAGLGIEEGLLGVDRTYIQPIDVWVARGIDYLERQGRPPQTPDKELRKKDRHLREKAGELADEIKVTAAQFNTALFVLGAKFALTREKMEESLGSHSVFQGLAEGLLERAQAEASALRGMLEVS